MGNKRYLVTGGAGFIGSALIRRLVQEGHQVRVLDNQSRGSVIRLHDIINEFEFIQADIRDPEAVRKAVKGVDSVCHLASINGTEFFYSKSNLVLEVGVKGIVNVIDACLKYNIGELIVASSSEVYQTPPVIPTDETVPLSIPDPLNPRYSYATVKIISEVMALNYGQTHFERVVIFRPHNVFGPDMGWEHVVPQFILRMKELGQYTGNTILFPIQGTGKETRAFVFIDDFIDGLMLVLNQGEHLDIYHIGTTEEMSISEVAHLVAGYFGWKIEIVPGKLTMGSTQRRCPDITKLTKLGYHPEYSFKDGLHITAKWYDENVHKAPREQLEKAKEWIKNMNKEQAFISR